MGSPRSGRRSQPQRDDPPPDPRSRRDPEVAARVERVGLELFDRDGFDRTSVVELAEQADVSPITVYRTFGTKGGIVFWTRDREADRLQRLASAREVDADPRVTVAECLRQYAVEMPLDLLEYSRYVRVIRQSPHLKALALAGRLKYERALHKGLGAAGLELDLAGRTACAGASGALDVATRQWHRRGNRRRPWAADVDEALAALWPDLPR